jgi:tRNA(adenine34) deaminase
MSLENSNEALATFMRAALAEADAAGQAGEMPIGAVLVIGGEIVSRGRSRQNERQNQIAHAELLALQGGGARLFKEFKRAMLFTTVEPCPMCLGAVTMADVPHLFFGVHDAVVQSGRIYEASAYIRKHVQTYQGGVLEMEVRALMQRHDPELLAKITTGRAPETT